jgi:hypothetical protein
MTTDLDQTPHPAAAPRLERAIGISGRYAVQRAVGELVDGYRRRHAQRFRYEGATAGRRAYGWYAASTDANVELMGALIWLRNRSRDLIRNNPYAARAVEELAGNVVGTGIVPKAKTGATRHRQDHRRRVAVLRRGLRRRRSASTSTACRR